MRVAKGDDGARLRARLDRACSDTELLRVHRGIPGADRVDGYPVAIGHRWVLLSAYNGGGLDGFTAIRVSDITRIQSDPFADFARRALQHHGTWPPAKPDQPLDLDGTRRLIDSAAAANPLVTVYTERQHPNECSIGFPARWTKRLLYLWEIDPGAHWKPAHDTYQRKAITRVDVGARYETALHGVGGPPPNATLTTRTLPTGTACPTVRAVPTNSVSHNRGSEMAAPS